MSSVQSRGNANQIIIINNFYGCENHHSPKNTQTIQIKSSSNLSDAEMRYCQIANKLMREGKSRNEAHEYMLELFGFDAAFASYLEKTLSK